MTSLLKQQCAESVSISAAISTSFCVCLPAVASNYSNASAVATFAAVSNVLAAKRSVPLFRLLVGQSDIFIPSAFLFLFRIGSKCRCNFVPGSNQIFTDKCCLCGRVSVRLAWGLSVSQRLSRSVSKTFSSNDPIYWSMSHPKHQSILKDYRNDEDVDTSVVCESHLKINKWYSFKIILYVLRTRRTLRRMFTLSVCWGLVCDSIWPTSGRASLPRCAICVPWRF